MNCPQCESYRRLLAQQDARIEKLATLVAALKADLETAGISNPS